jgi:glycosyltransferase involved in cell wall biosynthesis
VTEGRRSVLVLSHLFPSTRHPYLGLFVARQVRAVGETHDIRVVAPTRWLPPLTRSWRKERALPRKEILDGTPVYRPRTLQLPFGLMTAEALAFPVALRHRVRHLERERAIDLVHTHFGLPDGWGGARIVRRLRVPLVVSLWGSDVLVFPQQLTLRRLLSHALRRAAEVIAPSSPIADRAVELGADPDRTSVVMGGVPDDYRPGSRADARESLALPADIRLVVWVGGLVPVKQPLLALHATCRVAARDPDVRLAIIGDGPLMSQVRETVRELRLEQVVRLLGALDSAEVAVWQAAADVVLNTSRSEGLPFALSEALVSGTRVAAPPVGGIPELLAATSGGTLAADWSPEAIAAAIEQELRRPPDRDLPQRAAFLRLSNVAPRIADIYERSLRS